MAKKSRVAEKKAMKSGSAGAYRKNNSVLSPDLEKKIKWGIVIGLLVAAIAVAFDLFPLIGARGTIQDRADQAAVAAASAVKNKALTSVTAQQAYNAALMRISDNDLGITIVESSFKVNSNGTVTFTATEEVSSFLVSRLYPDWFKLKVTTTAGPGALS